MRSNYEYVLSFVENARGLVENVRNNNANVRSLVANVRSLFAIFLRGHENIPLALPDAVNEAQEGGCMALMIT